MREVGVGVCLGGWYCSGKLYVDFTVAVGRLGRWIELLGQVYFNSRED